MTQLPLADEYFLVAHDQYTGKAHISDGALDTGLAGAILGELVLSGRVAIDENTIVVVRYRAEIGESVADAAMAELCKQQDSYPVRAWVEYLRDHARMLVADRVITTGLVERAESRTLLRQSVRYPALDRVRAAGPQTRLHYVFDRPQLVDAQTAILGGLVLTTGLDHTISGPASRSARDALLGMVDQLGPDLKALVIGVEAAVAQLALNPRR